MKDDCFAFTRVGKAKRCSALTVVMCKDGKCPFYKTKQEYEEEVKRLYGKNRGKAKR